jgi:hypothetical protein
MRNDLNCASALQLTDDQLPNLNGREVRSNLQGTLSVDLLLEFLLK